MEHDVNATKMSNHKPVWPDLAIFGLWAAFKAFGNN